MRSRRSRFISLTASIVLVLPSLVATAVPAFAAKRLGPVDVQLFCDRNYGLLTIAKWSKFNDPYSWRCESRVWPYQSAGGVDMNRACVYKYGAGAYAGLAARNVTGWYCQR